MIVRFIIFTFLTILIRVEADLGFDETNEHSLAESQHGRSRVKRLQNGLGVHHEESTFMASVIYYGKHHCSSTIYSPYMLLTAAYCVTAKWIKKMQVRVGSYRFDYGGWIHNVHKVGYHPEYIPSITSHDVAVIKVEEPIEFDERVTNVNLYRWHDLTPLQTKGVVINWGLTDYPSKLKDVKPSPLLLRLNVTAWFSVFCYGESKRLETKQFCTWAGQNNACSGDSGGAFMVFKDNTWWQAGILSTSGCAFSRPGSMYWAEVAGHVDWIKLEMLTLFDDNVLPYARRSVSEKKKEYFRENRGTKISSTDAPWTVAIMSAEAHQFRCSGVIIHPRHVLTTATCVEENMEYLIYAGSTSPLKREVFAVTRKFLHENVYDKERNLPVNDVAVLRLYSNIRYNDHISQIDMAPTDEPVIRDMLASVYFWQAGNNFHPENNNITLYSMPLKMMGSYECSGIYKQSEEGYVSQKQVCATNNFGMCMKILGGPLVINNVLFGIYSWKKYCDDIQFPNVFSSVADFRPWIESCFRK